MGILTEFWIIKLLHRGSVINTSNVLLFFKISKIYTVHQKYELNKMRKKLRAVFALHA